VRQFDYVAAQSIDEAVELLNHPELVSRPLAGGTDVLVALRVQEPWFDRLIDIHQIPELNRIEIGTHEIQLGAALSFTALSENDDLRRVVPFLVQACEQVGSWQIRNTGTLGGNVINAAACADSLPPLVCLGAQAHLRSSLGERSLLVEDLVQGPHKTSIVPGELLTHFSFKHPELGTRSAFIKLGRRNAQSISRLSIAVMGKTDQQGKIEAVRITPGAATPRTSCFTSVEQALLGQKPGEELFISAGAQVAEAMIAITGQRWSTPYKDPVIRALTERALRQVFSASPDEQASSQAQGRSNHAD
jgi:xanthine dehydrogenase FAD-binding subunit